MLDVQGGQDVDAGVEQLVNILPAVGVRAVRGIGVGVVIDDGRGRPAADDSVQVQLFEVEPLIRNPLGRDQLEPCQQGAGVAAPPVPGKRDDDVLAAFAQPVPLPEHRVGLADAGC